MAEPTIKELIEKLGGNPLVEPLINERWRCTNCAHLCTVAGVIAGNDGPACPSCAHLIVPVGGTPADAIERLVSIINLIKTAAGSRDLADYMGEAMRRYRCGLVRPLWADMPEGEEKERWRGQGREFARSIEHVGLAVVLPQEKSGG